MPRSPKLPTYEQSLDWARQRILSFHYGGKMDIDTLHLITLLRHIRKLERQLEPTSEGDIIDGYQE